MIRALPLVLILTGCAAPEPPKPLTAMDVYQKIREALLGASTLEAKFRAPEYSSEMSGRAIFASGNRVWILSTWLGGTVISRDQTARYTGGFMPTVGACPADLATTLRTDLLRGMAPDFPLYYSTSRRGFRNGGQWESHTALSHFALEAEPPTLSFVLADPKSEHPSAVNVSIRYDAVTFAPLQIVSRFPSEANRAWLPHSAFTLTIDVTLNIAAPDDLFVVPEDPQIRITRAKAELVALKDALDLYAIDNHAYPTTEQGLQALKREPEPKPRNWKGPYIGESAPIVDPWDRPYFYRSPRRGINPRGYDLSSWGWDGKPDTLDDLR